MLDGGQSISSQSLTTEGGYEALTNPVDFSIYCPSVGMTVPVTIIYDKAYPNSQLRFYNSRTGKYSIVSGATFNTISIGGVSKTEVTYNATDGGANDSNATASGVIDDPVGLVSVVITAPNTGFGRPTQYNEVDIFLLIQSVVFVIGGLGYLRHRFNTIQ